MASKDDFKRKRDLAAALKRTKDDDALSLESLALLWGTTKQRFVTVRNSIPEFPNPLKGSGNSYVYEARAAVKAMLDFARRHDNVDRARQKRAQQILGVGRRGQASEDIGQHSPSELMVLARLRAQTEEQERDQGLYVPVAEVAAVAAAVFSEMSEFVSGISNAVDPHGFLTPEIRSTIQGKANDALLRVHKRMRDMLDPDAKPRPARAKARRSRKA